MKRLRFATAGIPLSTKPRDTFHGIAQVRKLGLDAMELEFVRSVNIKKGNAAAVKEAAKKHDVVLTCHAPYFINLNAKEGQKRGASRARIIKSAEVLHGCGGYSCCFHPGFYLGMEPKPVAAKMKEQVGKVASALEEKGVNCWLRPETTGKPTQYGSLEELLDLSRHFERVLPCIDFSHMHARSNGKYNTPEEFRGVLELVEKEAGKRALKEMHIHLSGIAYGEKGEKHHLLLEESDMQWRDLLAVWKEFKLAGVVVCESPNIEEDSLLLQKAYLE